MTKITCPEGTAYDDDGNDMPIPGKHEVCPRCEGRGVHVNPAIDGNGLTAEDFAEDPDFREDYLSGVYDVVCQECRGRRVVTVPDRARMNRAQRRALVRTNRARAELAADERSERILHGDY